MNRRNVIPTFLLAALYMVSVIITQAFQVGTILQLATIGLFLLCCLVIIYRVGFNAKDAIWKFGKIIASVASFATAQALGELSLGLGISRNIPLLATGAGFIGGGLVVVVAYVICRINPDLNPFPPLGKR